MHLGEAVHALREGVPDRHPHRRWISRSAIVTGTVVAAGTAVIASAAEVDNYCLTDVNDRNDKASCVHPAQNGLTCRAARLQLGVHVPCLTGSGVRAGQWQPTTGR